MNTLERTLIEKAGADNGWECVLESGGDLVRLASARHASIVEICDLGSLPYRFKLNFSVPVNDIELKRDLPKEFFHAGIVTAYNEHTLGAILRRYAELLVSLPSHPFEEYEKEMDGIIENEPGIRNTEAERIVRQRVGQDCYRKALLAYWKGQCAVTGIDIPEVLRASHAKPWAQCENDNDRLNVYNGFLLSADLDALFDSGLISFSDDGTIIVSSQIASYQRKLLQLEGTLRLRWIDEQHLPFLHWHRERIFRK